jgi:hypothetical protein
MAKKTVKTEAPAKAKKAAPAVKAVVVKKVAPAKKADDNDAIRKKAQEIYTARIARGEHGTAESDWHLAEKLVKEGAKKPVKKVAVKNEVVKKPAAKKK